MLSDRQSSDVLLVEKQMLTELSMALSEPPPTTHLTELLVSQLHKLTRSRLVGYLSYDAEFHVFTPVFLTAGQHTIQNALQGHLDKYPNGFAVSGHNYLQSLDHEVNVGSSLHEVSFGILPMAFEKVIESTLKFDRYYWISFTVSEILYGAAFFGLEKEQPDPFTNAI